MASRTARTRGNPGGSHRDGSKVNSSKWPRCKAKSGSSGQPTRRSAAPLRSQSLSAQHCRWRRMRDRWLHAVVPGPAAPGAPTRISGPITPSRHVHPNTAALSHTSPAGGRLQAAAASGSPKVGGTVRHCHPERILLNFRACSHGGPARLSA